MRRWSKNPRHHIQIEEPPPPPRNCPASDSRHTAKAPRHSRDRGPSRKAHRANFRQQHRCERDEFSPPPHAACCVDRAAAPASKPVRPQKARGVGFSKQFSHPPNPSPPRPPTRQDSAAQARGLRLSPKPPKPSRPPGNHRPTPTPPLSKRGSRHSRRCSWNQCPASDGRWPRSHGSGNLVPTKCTPSLQAKPSPRTNPRAES